MSGSSSSGFDGAPCASSPIAGTQLCAVAWPRRLGIVSSNTDIFVVPLDGGTRLQTLDMSTLESATTAPRPQLEPGIDSDGTHFLVAYTEQDPTFLTHNSFATDLHVSDNQLGISQSRMQLHPGLGIGQRNLRVASQRPPAAGTHRYAVPYTVTWNDQQRGTSFVFVEGVGGGPSIGFCSGDGSSGPCPCGNPGAFGSGCGNSANASGAQLDRTGISSTVSDNFRLTATGLPVSSVCLFFQGTTAGTATAFGDGLRCTTGTVVRLVTRTATSLGTVQYPAPGETPISVLGAVPVGGGLRAYQIWYRNAASFCTTATFNLTNGMIVNWAR
jgi:hypothetical protein